MVVMHGEMSPDNKLNGARRGCLLKHGAWHMNLCTAMSTATIHITMAKRWQKMAKIMMMRVGLEPTQLSLLAPEASALTAWRMLDGG
jgi:hypothetical protein